MPVYAPFYIPPACQQAFLSREQKRERKRKREEDGDGDGDDNDDDDGNDDHDDSDEEQHAPREQSLLQKTASSRVSHPVHRTDPYYVAGHPRDKPLPGGNFPHATVNDFGSSEPSVEEELAGLNPPLFAPKVASPQDQLGSSKRQHMDNLTAILHKCILHQDWKRASRVWGLILRTEIQGYGPDIRRNGHWMIGAEILMRNGQTFEQYMSGGQEAGGADSNFRQHDDHLITTSRLTDEGFRLARKYYERLILQYPHRPRAPHAIINALAIYPALFSVWIHEVEDEAKRSRRSLDASRDQIGGKGGGDVDGTTESGFANHIRNLFRIRARELEGALAISRRMDDLMLNPPYDTSSELLRARGMVGLWLSDLHRDISEKLILGLSESSSDDDDKIGPWRMGDAQSPKTQHQQQSDVEKKKARRAFEKLVAAKIAVPAQVQEFLDADDDSSRMFEDDDSR